MADPNHQRPPMPNSPDEIERLAAWLWCIDGLDEGEGEAEMRERFPIVLKMLETISDDSNAAYVRKNARLLVAAGYRLRDEVIEECAQAAVDASEAAYSEAGWWKTEYETWQRKKMVSDDTERELIGKAHALENFAAAIRERKAR